MTFIYIQINGHNKENSHHDHHHQLQRRKLMIADLAFIHVLVVFSFSNNTDSIDCISFILNIIPLWGFITIQMFICRGTV